MTIPEEAYKSAIKAAGKSVSVEMHALPAFLDAIAAALEAAAPYLIQAAKAEAWDEGRGHGARYPYGERGLATDDNPYR